MGNAMSKGTPPAKSGKDSTATIGFAAGGSASVIRHSSLPAPSGAALRAACGRLSRSARIDLRPVLWSDPAKVPAMAFEKAKCDDPAGTWAKTKQPEAFTADVAAKTANFHVETLLKQLNPMPLEIRVANLCYETCPSLCDMQAASITAHLRQISEVFSPKIKALAPPDAFQKNVAMNAALALNWARLSRSRLCLLPYESAGSRMKAECIIFAKDDSHAEDIVHLCGEVFGKGNDFCKKISYRTIGTVISFTFRPRLVVRSPFL